MAADYGGFGESMTEAQEVELTDNERQPCEIWTRVMGYFRPLMNWNPGKKSEHAERVYFKQEKAMKEQKND